MVSLSRPWCAVFVHFCTQDHRLHIPLLTLAGVTSLNLSWNITECFCSALVPSHVSDAEYHSTSSPAYHCIDTVCIELSSEPFSTISSYWEYFTTFLCHLHVSAPKFWHTKNCLVWGKPLLLDAFSLVLWLRFSNSVINLGMLVDLKHVR